MNLKTALSRLDAAGTAQNRKVYLRHGAAEPLFGVSYAELDKLKKAIGTDHDLALELWSSGNHDARVLATLVADPARATARTLDAWARQAGNHILSSAVGGVAAAGPRAQRCMEKWMESDNEWIKAAGWDILTHRAMAAQKTPVEGVDAAGLGAWLQTIEADIHQAPNRARHAMNGALIAIGLFSTALQKRALAAARRIGRVEVDHGETGCKTPDAAAYIRRASERGRQKRGR